VRAIAPGRVNLIGDHTDYTGGLVFPMAINRHTVIDARFTDDSSVSLKSADEPDAANFSLPISDIPSLQPQWARYIAAVASECKAMRGITGTVTTDIPIGSGLSSSAALEVAAALALGFNGSQQDLAKLAQRAEHVATGVPTGIMDQLCIATAQENHAMLIDCSTLEIVLARFRKSAKSLFNSLHTAHCKVRNTPIVSTSAMPQSPSLDRCAQQPLTCLSKLQMPSFSSVLAT
jgi:galactokinase